MSTIVKFQGCTYDIRVTRINWSIFIHSLHRIMYVYVFSYAYVSLFELK